MKSKGLRSGYTTGACAAAAAKAAVMGLLASKPGYGDRRGNEVEIPFPGGNRVRFNVHSLEIQCDKGGAYAVASIIKDAGDDPDVTHNAEIVARVSLHDTFAILGGQGVGRVTKPGLPVPVGEPAINPVPRMMMQEAIDEVRRMWKERFGEEVNFSVEISVPDGERLAKKTLNSRLGIIGGISILGTTGIVKPVSSESWKATITTSMDVAKATGCKEIIISSGRTSEKSHMRRFSFPEESYVMMGDYVEFSLREARKHSFSRIHLCAQWSKMVKIAMATPQTHVRHGALHAHRAVDFLRRIGVPLKEKHDFATCREIFVHLSRNPVDTENPFRMVCEYAKRYGEQLTGTIPVTSQLVSYDGEIIATSE